MAKTLIRLIKFVKFAIPYRKYTNDLLNSGTSNMRIRTILSILVILLTLQLSARPARRGIYTFTQPDGSTFPAVCFGDEFLRIIKTQDGHAIVKDNEGWWCYAIYNNDGSRESSGYRIGSDVPYEVLSQSRNIPYETLAANAQRKRAPFTLAEEGMLKRAMKVQGANTLTETSVTKHVLVILVQYSDIKFEYERQDFVNMLTEQGYSVNGATGSVKEYFDSQFGGMLDFDFQVSEIVTLDNTRAHYGQNDKQGNDLRPAEMVEQACRLAHEGGVDFSLYDDDSDGIVDNVFVFFAGEDEADNPDEYEDRIWSHSWYIKSGAGIRLELDGKIIDQYACTSELMPGGKITGIGTFCHEFAHTLGLPDFYDTDYDEETDWAAGLWGWTSLMDAGNQNNDFNTPPYFNAIERELLGLSEPITLERNGSYTLQPIHKSGQYYKIPSETSDSEYYLLECRSNDGWDKYIGGSGMLVYHIDKSEPSVWDLNTINIDPNHQYADLIEADGRKNSITSYTGFRNIAGIFFPYESVTSLTPESDPGIMFWNGDQVNTSITEIKRNGENITFVVSGLGGVIPPTPVNLKVDPFIDAAILSFESDKAFNGNAKVTWGKPGQENETVTLAPYETGKYAVIIEGLKPGNKTYSATISFEADGVEGPRKTISFMTTRTAPVEWAYIYLGNKSASNGTYAAGTKVPLRVYNAAEAEATEWDFNGRKTGPGGDGYFTISENGVLRATVYWPNGETDILEKQIILSE